MRDFAILERDPRYRILNTLEVIIAKVKERVTNPYQFRFVSAGQAKQAEMLLGSWAQAGRPGPQPVVDPISFRAAIYNQGRTSALLAAFHRVTSVTTTEFGAAAAEGFRAGNLTVPCAALRCLIERIALAGALADAVRGLSAARVPAEMPLKPVLELAETVMKAVYGTNRDWMKLAQMDLRTTPVKDVAYVVRADTANYKAANVLNAIDKLEKRVRGSRLVYELLCEFLHPNVGDLYGASLENSDLTDRYGVRHLIRHIGLGPKRLEHVPEVQRILTQMLDISADIVETLPAILDDIETGSKYASQLTRQFAHKVVQLYRAQFDHHDLCPCLSGLQVKDCARRSRFRR
jgi:hypothetical protein